MAATTVELDATHDPARRAWVESANDPANDPACDFPIQNLPYGSFRPRGGGDGDWRLGVAIGDRVLDLKAAAEADALAGASPEVRCALAAAHVNDLARLGRAAWRQARVAIGDLLDASATPRPELLHAMADVELRVPAAIGDYTDFYCSIHHATNVGMMFRPDNPLLPNYKHLPIGYHGRASSIVPSGTPIRRPMGQTVAADGELPGFRACRLLDYELEMGFYVGRGNALGERIPMAEAGEHLFGLSLVNDWSARDVQKWEYQPLGPFNAKNFATTVAPWIVTAEALAPVRVDGPPRGDGDPPVLDYLKRDAPWGFEITCEVGIRSKGMIESGAEATVISTGSFVDMYWTIAQMLVHHASTGCNLRPGDLIASGTISGPAEDSRGCLLERTWRGQKPVTLGDGTERKFLADGDEVVMRAWAQAGDGGPRLGFGECRGTVLPAE